jgi:hypothetical protein
VQRLFGLVIFLGWDIIVNSDELVVHVWFSGHG